MLTKTDKSDNVLEQFQKEIITKAVNQDNQLFLLFDQTSRFNKTYVVANLLGLYFVLSMACDSIIWNRVSCCCKGKIKILLDKTIPLRECVMNMKFFNLLA